MTTGRINQLVKAQLNTAFSLEAFVRYNIEIAPKHFMIWTVIARDLTLN